MPVTDGVAGMSSTFYFGQRQPARLQQAMQRPRLNTPLQPATPTHSLCSTQRGQLLFVPAAATHCLLADAQLLGDLLQLLVVQDVGQLLGVLVAVSHAVRGAQGGVSGDVHALQAGYTTFSAQPTKLAAVSARVEACRDVQVQQAGLD